MTPDGNQSASGAPLPRLLSAKQLYEILGLGRKRAAWRSWLWRAAKRGDLRPVRLSSGSVAYREDDVRQLIERGAAV